MRLLHTDAYTTSLCLPAFGAKFKGGVALSRIDKLRVVTCKVPSTQPRCPRLGLSVSDSSYKRFMMLSTALKLKCAAEQTQTQTRKSPTITIAPVFGKEKLPRLDDGGSGMPPRDDGGGGGGGGGGHNSFGGFFFFSFLIILNYIKELEEKAEKNARHRSPQY